MTQLITIFENAIKFSYQLIKSLPDITRMDSAARSTKISYKNNNSLIILGNGPSLKNDINHIADKVNKNDFICLNNFPQNDLFDKLKPNQMVWMDSNFWSKNVSNETISEREKTFSDLHKKAEWDIVIYIPHWADEDYLKSKIKKNNIKIIKLKMISFPYEGRIARKLYKTGFFCPRLMNVLVAAILIGINQKYKDVFIYGADFNFHRLIDVDQKNNRTLFKQDHFYGETSYYPVDHDMYTFLQSAADTYHAHKQLAKYAEETQVNIFNNSSFSLIDSYNRS